MPQLDDTRFLEVGNVNVLTDNNFQVRVRVA